MRRALGWMALLIACGPAPAEQAAEGAPAEDAPALPATVRIAPEAALAVGIVIGEARAGASVPEGTMPAEVRIDPVRRTEVSTLVAGRVAAVSVTVGARVEPGQVLATLASAEAADLAAASAQARARVASAAAAVERIRALRERGIAAQRSMIEAETELAQARAELAGLGTRRGVVGGGAHGSVRLVAPIAGTVVDVRAAPGATLEPGVVAFVIADTSEVWAVGRATERLVAELREGAPVRLRLFAYGAERWEGTLSYVAPVLDPTTHTLEVRMELANPDGRLRPGLLGAMEIASRDQAGRVSVPRDAIAELGGTEVVFVPTAEPGVYSIVPVAVERRDADEAVIVHGLEAGARIVTAGAFVLQSEVMRGALEDER